MRACNVGGSMIAGQHVCMYVCGAVCARVMHVGLVCVHVSVRGPFEPPLLARSYQKEHDKQSVSSTRQ